MTGLSGFRRRPSGGARERAVKGAGARGESVVRTGGCAGRGRARGALASALLTCASGCVLPYWDLAVEPPAVNSIPVILPESVVPQQRTLEPIEATVGRGCAHRTFSATAIDYDGADQLHYKWIFTVTLDSDVRRTFELVEGIVGKSEVPIDAIVPGLSEHAPFASSYKDLTLELTHERLLAILDIDDIANDGKHLLELWVSDRSFAPGVAVTTPETPPGAAPQPAEGVSWLLSLKKDDCDEGTP